MKTILIIDDEADLAEVIKSTIESEIADTVCVVEVDFRKAPEKIGELRPDAIILDLMEGHQSQNLPGQSTWKSIWDNTFCPIVIYTGYDAELAPPVPPNHPFVKRIAKGNGTQTHVVVALREFAPAMTSVERLRKEVDAVIHKVLRDTAGEGHMPMDDDSYLLHAGRRRIAAAMDDPTIDDNRKMAHWEQYLIPAIGDAPLTADLLWKQGTDTGSPENYRLVLTPSCDLDRGGRVQNVLVANCHSPKVMLDKFRSAVKPKKDADLLQQLTTLVLTQGSWNGWLPLPEFAGHVPAAVANLKDLSVLPFAAIGPRNSSDHEYVRVASIDSPFREQVAWAYLTTSARPGMPERDLKTWAEEFVNSAAAQ
jgi:CheY-like chemotaxis protein